MAVHPWPASPLSQFLATFGRASAAVWPAQIVWYLTAVAIVALALWPVRRSSQMICALAAAYLAWIGIAYFAWQMPGMPYSWLWATVFTLQAVLLVVAGIVRRDLVIRPRWDLASGLGAVFHLLRAHRGGCAGCVLVNRTLSMSGTLAARFGRPGNELGSANKSWPS